MGQRRKIKIPRPPRVTLQDFEGCPIRARIDKYSVWHPRRDWEFEVGSLEELETLLAEAIAYEVDYALNNETYGHGSDDDLTPLALRMSPCTGDKPTLARWINARSLFDVDVEVQVSIRPKPQRSASKQKKGKKKK